MIEKACKQIELFFWEIFIFTLSNSKLARNLVIHSSGIMQELKETHTLRMVGAVTIVGLISGFLLYILRLNLP
jgi:hypothetical protein